MNFFDIFFFASSDSQTLTETRALSVYQYVEISPSACLSVYLSISLLICSTFPTRSLCVDALIELSDENADWKLSFNEFLNCLRPDFNPPEKSKHNPLSYFSHKHKPKPTWKHSVPEYTQTSARGIISVYVLTK